MPPIKSKSFLFNDKKYKSRNGGGRSLDLKKIDHSGRSELDIDSYLFLRRWPKFLGENVSDVDDDDDGSDDKCGDDNDVDDDDDDDDDNDDDDEKKRKKMERVDKSIEMHFSRRHENRFFLSNPATHFLSSIAGHRWRHCATSHLLTNEPG